MYINNIDISRDELMTFLSENRKEVNAASCLPMRDISFIYSKVIYPQNIIEIWGMTPAKKKQCLFSIHLPRLDGKYRTTRQILQEKMFDNRLQAQELCMSTWRNRRNFFSSSQLPPQSRFFILVGKSGALTYPGGREVRTFYNRRTVDNIKSMINSDPTGFYPDNDYKVVLVRDLGTEASTDNVWDYALHFEKTSDGWYAEKRA